MSLIVTMRRQQAVWWKRLTSNEEGAFTYASPVQIKCRWDDVSEEYIDMKGEKQSSKALVYVDRIIAVGDRLKKGPIDSSIGNDPLVDDLALEVRQFEQTPNLRNTETLLTAFLGGHVNATA